MNTLLSPDIREVMNAGHYKPSVSIILPFEPKMGGKAEIMQQLKCAVDKVEREIKQTYNNDLSAVVLQKLRTVIRNLNFSTYKKSIAIYISPFFEKVLYLDIPVKEHIIVNGSFEIRDLLFSKKELHQYLVLILSARSSKVYLGNTTSFTKVKANVPDHIAAFRHDGSHFGDPLDKKEVLLKKFLQHTDDGLKFLLHVYPFPVFVMGSKKVLGLYRAFTKNEKSIAGYVPGHFEKVADNLISDALKPLLDNWAKVKADDLRHQMEKAADAGKLSSGIQEVWKQASQHRGRLLIVENNFMCSAEKKAANEEVIYMPAEPYNKFSYIKDAVDDVIEKVLEDGGDVEFVEDGTLADHQHISLIQYY
jgi:hypothetical protein